MIRRAVVAVFAGLLIGALGLAGAWLWFRHAVFVDRTLPVEQTSVIVPEGSTGAEITTLLAYRHIIRSPLAFDLLARLRHQRSNFKAGEFRFATHLTADEVLRKVTTGGAQVAIWVTIPEGYTAREVAHVLAARSLGNEAALTAVFLSSPLELAGTPTRNLEGYLFPSTYLVPTSASPEHIAKIFTDQFRAELPKNAGQRAKSLGLNVPQVVTLASLVEREAKADDERALMAGVYYNRLHKGMPLEVDATIEYSFTEHKDVITRADLARDGPYNTYTRQGLPPTPIANPGRPSLLAAFNPQPSPFLFYVYKGDGHHAFSRTLAEHNANVARYLH